jgi:hypothetical protein
MMPEIIHITQPSSAASGDGVWGKLTFELPCPARRRRDLVQDGDSSSFLPRLFRMDFPGKLDANSIVD